uniref:thioredoxin-dependent peroxiredoxin n=1 Tax=Anolis carolinensis TaxID=28377 RepID=A0A803THP0_ANOCA
MATGHAKISKPAPEWEGTAVINGEFKELKFRPPLDAFQLVNIPLQLQCPELDAVFQVVACSVDSQFSHLVWINTQWKQGGFGPVSDLTHQISKDLEDQGHALRGLSLSCWLEAVKQ